jgi:hypothetical protein
MNGTGQEENKVWGRDEILRDIEERAKAYSGRVVKDVLHVMQEYEVDLYRLILAVGDRYGRDTAFEIMSDTVAEKRLQWLEQNWDRLVHEGTDLDRGLDLFIKYFKLKEEDMEILEKTEKRVRLKRKEFVNVISHTCRVLGLDVIEVNNKIYARATNIMLERINPRLRNGILGYSDGWYEEMIEWT